MDDENLLSGDGSAADFLNSTGADSVYGDNQTLGDALDNGPITSDQNSTTVGVPGWQQTMANLFTAGKAVVSTVTPLLGSTTGGAPKPSAGAAAAATSSKSSMMLYIGLAVVGIVLAFLFFRKH